MTKRLIGTLALLVPGFFAVAFGFAARHEPVAIIFCCIFAAIQIFILGMMREDMIAPLRSRLLRHKT